MAVERGRQRHRNGQRQCNGNLQGQRIHRMPLGKAVRPTHQAQEQLGQGEDEAAAKDQNRNAGTKRDPTSGSRRKQTK